MANPFSAGGVSHVFPLLDFAPGSDCPKILDTIDAINSLHGVPQAFGVVHIALNNLRTILCQLGRSASCGVPCQSPNTPRVPGQISDQCSSLPAGSAAD